MKSAQDTLNDLENIYSLAMVNENYALALKAKELLGKAQGLFSPGKRPKISLNDLTDEELENLLKEVEREVALDPHRENTLKVLKKNNNEEPT